MPVFSDSDRDALAEVSTKWIKKKVGHAKASKRRLQKFRGKMARKEKDPNLTLRQSYKRGQAHLAATPFGRTLAKEEAKRRVSFSPVFGPQTKPRTWYVHDRPSEYLEVLSALELAQSAAGQLERRLEEVADFERTREVTGASAHPKTIKGVKIAAIEAQALANRISKIEKRLK